MRRTIRPQAGVMTLMCGKCAEMNGARNGSREAPRHFGTFFIPVSLQQKAAIEAGHTAVREVACHQHGHRATVTLQG